MTARLIFAGLFFCGVAFAEDDSPVIALGPRSTGLTQVNVPLLHEEVEEEELSGRGLLLEPDKGLYDWTSNGAFRLRVEVDATKFEHGILTVWNWHNRALQQRRYMAGEPALVDIEVEGYGCYLLTLDGFVNGKYRKRLIRNIGVTPDLNAARESWKKDEFLLGICTFPGRYHWMPGGVPTLPAGLSESDAREHEAEMMARLGFQVVRIDESLEMGRRENEGGVDYLFNDERMDASVEAYTSRGFELGLQLMSAADWAVDEKYETVLSHRWRYPHEEQAQRAYIKALLDRYGKQARFVQIFNEPDQVEFWAGTPDEFVDQFQFSHDQIEKNHGELPVANGGYAFVDPVKTRFFIDHLNGLIDLPSYHSHGELKGMIKNFQRLKTQYRGVGIESAEWMNTETGFDAWRLDQERRQAQAVAQKVLYSWANEHAGIMLFCGRMTRGPGREGRDLGLVDYQFCPRFAYGAIAGLVSALEGASFESTLVQSRERFVYVFRKGADLIVAGFSTDDAGTVGIESDAVEIQRIDAMGNPQPGSEMLVLDGYPRYWVLKKAGSVALKK
ncbi:MAG: hypothetical protein P1U68_13550 [Verrucomicrobiales bacterium]|nr:hypothetical protein [Verrucomicrobiales bacterium]